jgi:hypothetical protein
MKLVDALEQWRSDDLKKYVTLLNGDSRITRKADRINFIRQALLNQASLHFLWQQMDGISWRAISVAFHNEGEFNNAAFVAQYGGLPPRPKKKDGWSSYYHKEPIPFDLFVIDGQIPDDLMLLLADLVLPPERFQLEGMTEEPAKLKHDGYVEDVTAVETEVIGRTDLLTYLQLVDQQQLRFSDKNKRLTAASVRKVLANLVAEDFREAPEQVSGRTTIRPTGLDVFTQESGLATRTGKLTKAGRTYLHTQDPEIMLEAFEKWTTGGKFDELHRITQLGGLKSRGTRLTLSASRREKVIEALSWCPVGQWIDVSDFCRAFIIWDFDFEVEKTNYSHLYVGSRNYGDLNSSGNYWGLTNGLYINAIIWEYLGTIGAVDVAFLEDDFTSLLDTRSLDIEEPVSLYDGLSHFRINPWGAFLLGQADEYVPSQPKQKALFTIDADKRVHLAASLSPSERLQLEAMADPIDEQTYQLDEMKLLTAVEGGQKFDPLIDFLRNGHQGEMPPAILDWLFQLRRNQGAFKESDTAVLIYLNQPSSMDMVQQDKVLAKVCQPVDESTILVRSSHLARFRKRLKALGYLLA